jgi:carbamoyl-phosphate synthase large subunit
MMKTAYYTTAAGALAEAQAIIATVEDTLEVRPLQSYA